MREADLKALSAAREHLAWLKREREVAGELAASYDEEIRDQARRITQLQTWIDGGRL